MSPIDLLKSGKATTDEALALFDSLDPVDIDFMLGSWKGAGLCIENIANLDSLKCCSTIHQRGR